MEFFSQYFSEQRVTVQYSLFKKAGLKQEAHLQFIHDEDSSTFENQLAHIKAAIELTTQLDAFKNSKTIFKRYFLSDAANQYPQLIKAEVDNRNYALSVIQQPPLNGAKIAVWIYMAEDLQITTQSKYITSESNGYKHIWTSLTNGKGSNSYEQTQSILELIEQILESENCSLKENCIRTWFFVNNVDVNYADVVEARKELFTKRNMVPQTHYISSTGIEGRINNPKSLVVADAYSINGIKKGQVTFLKGLTHLNPTYEYGVTFERGTAVNYGDRKHIFISGTASIDNKGDIVHPNNVLKQTERAMENIQVLLGETNSQLTDIAQMIIYLRDVSDYKHVEAYYQTHFPHTPRVIVLAPVCRPGWLIEIECIAIANQDVAQFNNY